MENIILFLFPCPPKSLVSRRLKIYLPPNEEKMRQNFSWCSLTSVGWQNNSCILWWMGKNEVNSADFYFFFINIWNISEFSNQLNYSNACSEGIEVVIETRFGVRRRPLHSRLPSLPWAYSYWSSLWLIFLRLWVCCLGKGPAKHEELQGGVVLGENYLWISMAAQEKED